MVVFSAGGPASRVEALAQPLRDTRAYMSRTPYYQTPFVKKQQVQITGLFACLLHLGFRSCQAIQTRAYDLERT